MFATLSYAPEIIESNGETMPRSRLQLNGATDRRALMRFDWWTALSGQVRLQIQWSPEHQGERVGFMSIKSGTLKGLVMRCGAANERFGFFLDWMEDDETIQGNGEGVLPPQTNY